MGLQNQVLELKFRLGLEFQLWFALWLGLGFGHPSQLWRRTPLIY